MDREYDIIIIGGGPNGLEIAAYLAKAGQKVLLLEKRFEAGGGMATEQLTLPDFYDNHAIFQSAFEHRVDNQIQTHARAVSRYGSLSKRDH